MTTKADQDIAPGFATTAADGGQEEKIHEGIMKPKDKDDSEYRHPEQNQPMDETSQGIAAGDPAGNANFPHKSGPDSEVRIPEGIMRPVQDGRTDKSQVANAATPSAIAAGRPLDADSGNVKIPEGIVQPRASAAQRASPLTAEVSKNVPSGEPLNARGFVVNESETKIPEGVMKPKTMASNIAAAASPTLQQETLILGTQPASLPVSSGMRVESRRGRAG